MCLEKGLYVLTISYSSYLDLSILHQVNSHLRRTELRDYKCELVHSPRWSPVSNEHCIIIRSPPGTCTEVLD